MALTLRRNEDSQAYNLIIFIPLRISSIILFLRSLFFICSIWYVLMFRNINAWKGITNTMTARPIFSNIRNYFIFKLEKSYKSNFFFRQIASLAVLNFFPEFKNGFLAIFANAKKGIWSKWFFMKLIYLISRVFFGLNFF